MAPAPATPNKLLQQSGHANEGFTSFSAQPYVSRLLSVFVRRGGFKGEQRMSAGFKVADEAFWGTNGAVEAYVEVLAAQAADRLGPEAPLTVFLRDERDGFYSGKIVFLDEWLADAAGRSRFLEMLDAATEQLLRAGAFTEYGREWVASVVTALRDRIARG